MDNQAVAVRPEQPMEMAVADLEAQIRKIQTIMRGVMQDGQHYGVIPGTDKPTLLKPGAEKLAMVFRLAPSFRIIRNDLPNNHREFEIICTLTHIPTGQVMGEGVGSCSTMESKYRWRRGEAEKTDKTVPSGYWNLRKTNPAKAQEVLGGKGFVTVKVDNVWWIAKKSDERIENTDIADTYNTVLKMAKKRAQVDATLTATAASDIFSQDLEDIHEVTPGSTISPEPEQTPIPAGNGDISYKQALWDGIMAHCKNQNADATRLLKELTVKAFVSNLSEG